MIKLKTYLMSICGMTFFMMGAYAQDKDLTDHSLMTIRDVQERALSNITITNGTARSVTVSGLFIASFDINDCSSCFGSVVSGDNVGGAMISPVTFKANQSVPIGQNFLYNMIYNGIYYIRSTVGSSPCSLPGCSWPGDDTNVQGWCISINAASLDSGYTFSNYVNGSNPPANSPPYASASNSNVFDYKYALINPASLGIGNACLGPVTCDDKTLTCKVSNSQNESFQPY